MQITKMLAVLRPTALATAGVRRACSHPMCPWGEYRTMPGEDCASRKDTAISHVQHSTVSGHLLPKLL
jgi:hypothetical protein